MRKKPLLRSLSMVLAVVYSSTNCLFAHKPETSVWDQRRRSVQIAQLPSTFLPQIPSSGFLGSLPPVATAARPSSKIVPPLISTLPLHFGSVRDVSAPLSPSGKTVLHLQDVHMNFEAQENISKTIQSLLRQNKIDLIAVEGAFGPLDLTAFHKFGRQDVVRSVMDAQLKENKTAGPLHAAMTQNVRFTGVDDPVHYDLNVEAYRRSSTAVKDQKKFWESETRRVKKEKARVFNSSLAAFDAKVEAYRIGRASMGDYVEALAASSKVISNAAVGFLEALRLERSMDYARVETERTELLARLTPKLSQRQSAGLANAAVALRMGQMSQADFYSDLETLCESQGVALAGFPAFRTYIRYVLAAGAIRADELFSATAKMETSIYATLAKTPEEKRLVAESKRLRLIGKLLDFSLTNDEWAEYKTEKGRGAAVLASFERFYEEAEIRDQKMARNFIKASEKSKASVLVTGGFHSNGVIRRLTEAGYTVVTFAPKISKVDTKTGSAYLSVFNQEKTPLEKIFEGQKLFLAQKVGTEEWRVQTALAMADAALRAHGDGFKTSANSLLAGTGAIVVLSVSLAGMTYAILKISGLNQFLLLKVAAFEITLLFSAGAIARFFLARWFFGSYGGEGNIAGPETSNEDLKRWKEEIAQSSAETAAEAPDAVDLVRESVVRFLSTRWSDIDAILGSLGLSRERVADLRDRLENFETSFYWFLARVAGPENYLLGYDRGLAVDVIRELGRIEKSGGTQNLIIEYVLHEALEAAGLNHDGIIHLTRRLFNRPEIPLRLNVRGEISFHFGATPLGVALREFISRVWAAAQKRRGEMVRREEEKKSEALTPAPVPVLVMSPEQLKEAIQSLLIGFNLQAAAGILRRVRPVEILQWTSPSAIESSSRNFYAQVRNRSDVIIRILQLVNEARFPELRAINELRLSGHLPKHSDVLRRLAQFNVWSIPRIVGLTGLLNEYLEGGKFVSEHGRAEMMDVYRLASLLEIEDRLLRKGFPRNLFFHDPNLPPGDQNQGVFSLGLRAGWGSSSSLSVAQLRELLPEKRARGRILLIGFGDGKEWGLLRKEFQNCTIMIIEPNAKNLAVFMERLESGSDSNTYVLKNEDPAYPSTPGDVMFDAALVMGNIFHKQTETSAIRIMERNFGYLAPGGKMICGSLPGFDVVLNRYKRMFPWTVVSASKGGGFFQFQNPSPTLPSSEELKGLALKATQHILMLHQRGFHFGKVEALLEPERFGALGISYFISVEELLYLGLFHPEWGYYSASRVKFGPDFLTLPISVSPFYGAIMCRQSFRIWQSMKKAGTLLEPVFEIAELGAGNGMMAQDFMKHARFMAEKEGGEWREFFEQLHYTAVDIGHRNIVQISEKLTALGLNPSTFNVVRKNSFDFLKEGAEKPIQGVILTNEILDTMPGHLVFVDPEGRVEVGVLLPLVRGALVEWAKLKYGLDASGFSLNPVQSRPGWFAIPANQFIRLKTLSEGNPELAEFFAYHTEAALVRFDAARFPDVLAYVAKNKRNIAASLAKNGDKPSAMLVSPLWPAFLQLQRKALRAGAILNIDYGDSIEKLLSHERALFATYTEGQDDRTASTGDNIGNIGRIDLTIYPDETMLAIAGAEAGAPLVFYGNNRQFLSGTKMNDLDQPDQRSVILADSIIKRADEASAELREKRRTQTDSQQVAIIHQFYEQSSEILKEFIEEDLNTGTIPAFDDDWKERWNRRLLQKTKTSFDWNALGGMAMAPHIIQSFNEAFLEPLIRNSAHTTDSGIESFMASRFHVMLHMVDGSGPAPDFEEQLPSPLSTELTEEQASRARDIVRKFDERYPGAGLLQVNGLLIAIGSALVSEGYIANGFVLMASGIFVAAISILWVLRRLVVKAFFGLIKNVGNAFTASWENRSRIGWWLPYAVVAAFGFVEDTVLRFLVQNLFLERLFGIGAGWAPAILFGLIFATLVHPFVLSINKPGRFQQIYLRTFLFLLSLLIYYLASGVNYSYFTGGVVHAAYNVAALFLISAFEINIPIAMAAQKGGKGGGGDRRKKKKKQHPPKKTSPKINLEKLLGSDRPFSVAGSSRLDFLESAFEKIQEFRQRVGNAAPNELLALLRQASEFLEKAGRRDMIDQLIKPMETALQSSAGVKTTGSAVADLAQFHFPAETNAPLGTHKLTDIPPPPAELWQKSGLVSIEYLDESRAAFAVALKNLIGEKIMVRLLPYLDHPEKIKLLLEVGAGGGALFEFSLLGLRNFFPGQSIPSWLQTDRSSLFLSQKRSVERETMELELLGKLPFTDGSRPAVLSMSALDTLELKKLPGVFAEFKRVIPDGGSILAVMDVVPQLEIQQQAARDQGMEIFPAYAEIMPGVGAMGGYIMLDWNKLISRYPEAPQDSLVLLANEYRWDPVRYFFQSTKDHDTFERLSQMALHLKTLAQRYGVPFSEGNSVGDLHMRQLRAVAENAGLTVVHAGPVRAQYVVERRRLPKFPARGNTIRLQSSLRGYGFNPSLKQQLPQFEDPVFIDISVHLFHAVKGTPPPLLQRILQENTAEEITVETTYADVRSAEGLESIVRSFYGPLKAMLPSRAQTDFHPSTLREWIEAGLKSREEFEKAMGEYQSAVSSSLLSFQVEEFNRAMTAIKEQLAVHLFSVEPPDSGKKKGYSGGVQVNGILIALGLYLIQQGAVFEGYSLVVYGFLALAAQMAWQVRRSLAKAAFLAASGLFKTINFLTPLLPLTAAIALAGLAGGGRMGLLAGLIAGLISVPLIMLIRGYKAGKGWARPPLHEFRYDFLVGGFLFVAEFLFKFLEIPHKGGMGSTITFALAASFILSAMIFFEKDLSPDRWAYIPSLKLSELRWFFLLPLAALGLNQILSHLFPGSAVFHYFPETYSISAPFAPYAVLVLLFLLSFRFYMPLFEIIGASGAFSNMSEIYAWKGALDPLPAHTVHINPADIFIYTGRLLFIAQFFQTIRAMALFVWGLVESGENPSVKEVFLNVWNGIQRKEEQSLGSRVLSVFLFLFVLTFIAIPYFARHYHLQPSVTHRISDDFEERYEKLLREFKWSQEGRAHSDNYVAIEANRPTVHMEEIIKAVKAAQAAHQGRPVWENVTLHVENRGLLGLNIELSARGYFSNKRKAVRLDELERALNDLFALPEKLRSTEAEEDAESMVNAYGDEVQFKIAKKLAQERDAARAEGRMSDERGETIKELKSAVKKIAIDISNVFGPIAERLKDLADPEKTKAPVELMIGGNWAPLNAIEEIRPLIAKAQADYAGRAFKNPIHLWVEGRRPNYSFSIKDDDKRIPVTAENIGKVLSEAFGREADREKKEENTQPLGFLSVLPVLLLSWLWAGMPLTLTDMFFPAESGFGTVLFLFFAGIFIVTTLLSLANWAFRPESTGPPIALFGGEAVPFARVSFVEFNRASQQYQLNPFLYFLLTTRFSPFGIPVWILLRFSAHFILAATLALAHEPLHASPLQIQPSPNSSVLRKGAVWIANEFVAFGLSQVAFLWLGYILTGSPLWGIGLGILVGLAAYGFYRMIFSRRQNGKENLESDEALERELNSSDATPLSEAEADAIARPAIEEARATIKELIKEWRPEKEWKELDGYLAELKLKEGEDLVRPLDEIFDGLLRNSTEGALHSRRREISQALLNNFPELKNAEEWKKSFLPLAVRNNLVKLLALSSLDNPDILARLGETLLNSEEDPKTKIMAVTGLFLLVDRGFAIPFQPFLQTLPLTSLHTQMSDLNDNSEFITMFLFRLIFSGENGIKPEPLVDIGGFTTDLWIQTLRRMERDHPTKQVQLKAALILIVLGQKTDVVAGVVQAIRSRDKGDLRELFSLKKRQRSLSKSGRAKLFTQLRTNGRDTAYFIAAAFRKGKTFLFLNSMTRVIYPLIADILMINAQNDPESKVTHLAIPIPEKFRGMFESFIEMKGEEFLRQDGALAFLVDWANPFLNFLEIPDNGTPVISEEHLEVAQEYLQMLREQGVEFVYYAHSKEVSGDNAMEIEESALKKVFNKNNDARLIVFSPLNRTFLFSRRDTENAFGVQYKSLAFRMASDQKFASRVLTMIEMEPETWISQAVELGLHNLDVFLKEHGPVSQFAVMIRRTLLKKLPFTKIFTQTMGQAYHALLLRVDEEDDDDDNNGGGGGGFLINPEGPKGAKKLPIGERRAVVNSVGFYGALLGGFSESGVKFWTRAVYALEIVALLSLNIYLLTGFNFVSPFIGVPAVWNNGFLFYGALTALTVLTIGHVVLNALLQIRNHRARGEPVIVGQLVDKLLLQFAVTLLVFLPYLLPFIPASHNLGIFSFLIGPALQIAFDEWNLIRWQKTADKKPTTPGEGYVALAAGRFIAMALIPAVLPIILLLAVFLKSAYWVGLSSDPRAFYSETRLGYKGEPFTVYKLRTVAWNDDGREKVTWFGRMARPFGVDELPQILSIAKGDMQWFGPRPHTRRELSEDYIGKILNHTRPGYWGRFAAHKRIALRAKRDSSAKYMEFELNDLKYRSLTYNTVTMIILIFAAVHGWIVTNMRWAAASFLFFVLLTVPYFGAAPPLAAQQPVTEKKAQSSSKWGEVMHFAYHFDESGALLPGSDRTVKNQTDLNKALPKATFVTVVNDFVVKGGKSKLKDRALTAKFLKDAGWRKKTIDGLIKAAEGTLGVAVDFENMGRGSSEDFKKFVEELSTALHAKKLQLSVVVEPKIERKVGDRGFAIDWAHLSKHADRVEVMAYWYSFKDPGELVPLSWVKKMVALAENEGLKGKFVVILPSYGYEWVDGKPKALDKTSWADIVKHKEKWKRTTDGNAIHYSYEDDAGKHIVYTEDLDSFKLKADELKKLGVKVGLWRMGKNTGDPEIFKWAKANGVIPYVVYWDQPGIDDASGAAAAAPAEVGNAPKDLKETSNREGVVGLSWSKVEGASHYTVYRIRASIGKIVIDDKFKGTGVPEDKGTNAYRTGMKVKTTTFRNNVNSLLRKKDEETFYYAVTAWIDGKETPLSEQIKVTVKAKGAKKSGMLLPGDRDGVLPGGDERVLADGSPVASPTELKFSGVSGGILLALIFLAASQIFRVASTGDSQSSRRKLKFPHPLKYDAAVSDQDKENFLMVWGLLRILSANNLGKIELPFRLGKMPFDQVKQLAAQAGAPFPADYVGEGALMMGYEDASPFAYLSFTPETWANLGQLIAVMAHELIGHSDKLNPGVVRAMMEKPHAVLGDEPESALAYENTTLFIDRLSERYEEMINFVATRYGLSDETRNLFLLPSTRESLNYWRKEERRRMWTWAVKTQINKIESSLGITISAGDRAILNALLRDLTEAETQKDLNRRMSHFFFVIGSNPFLQGLPVALFEEFYRYVHQRVPPAKEPIPLPASGWSPASFLFLILIIPAVYRFIQKYAGRHTKKAIVGLSLVWAVGEGVAAWLIFKHAGIFWLSVYLIALYLAHVIFEWIHPMGGIRAPPFSRSNLFRLAIFGSYFALAYFGFSPLFVLPFHLAFDYNSIESIFVKGDPILRHEGLSFPYPSQSISTAGRPTVSVRDPSLKHGDQIDLSELPWSYRSFLNHAGRYAGGALALVGGSVRDLFSGKKTKDFDVTPILAAGTVIDRTNRNRIFRWMASMEKWRGLLSRMPFYNRGGFASLGRFGGMNVEYSFSLEIMSDGTLARNVPELSINSMAISANGIFLDPFDGLNDLRNGIARIVGPEQAMNSMQILRVFRSKHHKKFNNSEKQLAWSDSSVTMLRQSSNRLASTFNVLPARISDMAAWRQIHNRFALEMFANAYDPAALYDELVEFGVVGVFESVGVHLNLALNEELARRNKTYLTQHVKEALLISVLFIATSLTFIILFERQTLLFLTAEILISLGVSLFVFYTLHDLLSRYGFEPKPGWFIGVFLNNILWRAWGTVVYIGLPCLLALGVTVGGSHLLFEGQAATIISTVVGSLAGAVATLYPHEIFRRKSFEMGRAPLSLKKNKYFPSLLQFGDELTNTDLEFFNMVWGISGIYHRRKMKEIQIPVSVLKMTVDENIKLLRSHGVPVPETFHADGNVMLFTSEDNDPQAFVIFTPGIWADPAGLLSVFIHEFLGHLDQFNYEGAMRFLRSHSRTFGETPDEEIEAHESTAAALEKLLPWLREFVNFVATKYGLSDKTREAFLGDSFESKVRGWISNERERGGLWLVVKEARTLRGYLTPSRDLNLEKDLQAAVLPLFEARSLSELDQRMGVFFRVIYRRHDFLRQIPESAFYELYERLKKRFPAAKPVLQFPGSFLFLILIIPAVYRFIQKYAGRHTKKAIVGLSLVWAVGEGVAAWLIFKHAGIFWLSVYLIALYLAHVIFEWIHPMGGIRAPPFRSPNVVRLLIFGSYFAFAYVGLSALFVLPFHLVFDFDRIRLHLLGNPLARHAAYAHPRPLTSVALPQTPFVSLTDPNLKHGDRVDVNQLPEPVRAFFRLARVKIGGSMALVGGAVRDILADGKINDFDTATMVQMDAEDAAQFRATAAPAGTVRMNLTGYFSHQGRRFYEIQLRLKELMDGLSVSWLRGRVFVHVLGLFRGLLVEQNISMLVSEDGDVRRVQPELSINSMALTSDGFFLDPWNGKQDLKDGVARLVGPMDRFKPDSIIRIMRGKHHRKLNNETRQLTWTPESAEILGRLAASFSHELNTNPPPAHVINAMTNHFAKNGVLKMFGYAYDPQALYAELQNFGFVEPFARMGLNLQDFLQAELARRNKTSIVQEVFEAALLLGLFLGVFFLSFHLFSIESQSAFVVKGVISAVVAIAIFYFMHDLFTPYSKNHSEPSWWKDVFFNNMIWRAVGAVFFIGLPFVLTLAAAGVAADLLFPESAAVQALFTMAAGFPASLATVYPHILFRWLSLITGRAPLDLRGKEREKAKPGSSVLSDIIVAWARRDLDSLIQIAPAGVESMAQARSDKRAEALAEIYERANDSAFISDVRAKAAAKLAGTNISDEELEVLIAAVVGKYAPGLATVGSCLLVVKGSSENLEQRQIRRVQLMSALLRTQSASTEIVIDSAAEPDVRDAVKTLTSFGLSGRISIKKISNKEMSAASAEDFYGRASLIVVPRDMLKGTRPAFVIPFDEFVPALTILDIQRLTRALRQILQAA